MNEFTFEARGWWNHPKTIHVLAKDDIFTEDLKNMIAKAFQKAKSLTSYSENEYNSFICPNLGDVNQAVYELSGYAHMFKSFDESKATLTIRKLQKLPKT